MAASAREDGAPGTEGDTTWEELLGGGDADSYLLVQLGQLLFVWPKESSFIKVLRNQKADPAELTKGGTDLRVALEVEVPPSLIHDPDPFATFCRAFIGMETTFALTKADVRLLTADLSDYGDSAERAMEAMLALDGRMRAWLKDEGKLENDPTAMVAIALFAEENDIDHLDQAIERFGASFNHEQERYRRLAQVAVEAMPGAVARP
jgi:hypothetical protein